MRGHCNDRKMPIINGLIKSPQQHLGQNQTL
jgi:hypothetical protein